MHPLINKAIRVASQHGDALLGRILFRNLNETLGALSVRPFELRLELTNVCNSNCVFCPYQFQQRDHANMSDTVFRKAVSDFVLIHGGSVNLTPIVGESLVDNKFLERVRYLRQFPEIDRITVTTNGILLDKVGIEAVLDSGLDTIQISTSGFHEESYKRIYRSKAYHRMLRNVTALVEMNAAKKNPTNIWICLRSDRPLADVMKDRDFQPILSHNPNIDFTWAFTSAGGRITRESLPSGMKLRVSSKKPEPCLYMYNGPIVLPDGAVSACACVAAVDALDDLCIGNILEQDLLEIYTSPRMQELRKQFWSNALNATCRNCDMYRNLDLYRTREGEVRAKLNRTRLTAPVRRAGSPSLPFAGG